MTSRLGTWHNEIIHFHSLLMTEYKFIHLFIYLPWPASDVCGCWQQMQASHHRRRVGWCPWQRVSCARCQCHLSPAHTKHTTPWRGLDTACRLSEPATVCNNNNNPMQYCSEILVERMLVKMAVHNSIENRRPIKYRIWASQVLFSPKEQGVVRVLYVRFCD